MNRYRTTLTDTDCRGKRKLVAMKGENRNGKCDIGRFGRICSAVDYVQGASLSEMYRGGGCTNDMATPPDGQSTVAPLLFFP